MSGKNVMLTKVEVPTESYVYEETRLKVATAIKELSQLLQDDVIGFEYFTHDLQILLKVVKWEF